MVQKYLNKISGSLLDRIDLHVEVTPVALSELSSKTIYEKSAIIRKRVVEARQIQNERFKGNEIHSNAQMSTKLTRKICQIIKPAQELLNTVMAKLQLSTRAYDSIYKLKSLSYFFRFLNHLTA